MMYIRRIFSDHLATNSLYNILYTIRTHIRLLFSPAQLQRRSSTIIIQRRSGPIKSRAAHAYREYYKIRFVCVIAGVFLPLSDNASIARILCSRTRIKVFASDILRSRL